MGFQLAVSDIHLEISQTECQENARLRITLAKGSSVSIFKISDRILKGGGG
jgi:hypothetical protein